MRFTRFCRFSGLVAAASLFAFSNGEAFAAAGSVCTAGQNVGGNTYLGFGTVPGNSNSPTERLTLVRGLSSQNAVEVPCSFTQSADGKTGTWTASSTVTDIIVKASTVQTVFDVPDGTSGSWSTQCIRNNGNQQPAISGVFCYNRGGTPPSQGTLVIQKKTLDANGNPIKSSDTFTLSIGGVIVGSLNTATNNPESVSISKAPGTYSVTESFDTSKWIQDSNSCTNVQVSANATATCLIVNKIKAQANNKGSITIEKFSNFGNGTFVFTVLAGNSPLNPVSLTTVAGQASKTLSSLDSGVIYKVSENVPDGWTLTSSTCRSTQRPSIPPSGIDLQPGEDVTCTFTNAKKKDDRAEDVTKLFIHRRVDNLLSSSPDRARILRRLDEQGEPVGLKDGGTYEGERFGTAGAGGLKDQTRSDLLKMQGRSESVSPGSLGDQKFSASLAQMQANAAANDRKKFEEAGLPYNARSGYGYGSLQPRLDVWVESHIAGYTDTLGGLVREGDFKALYVGADYAVRPGLLVGALVQLDRTIEDVKNPDLWGRVSGDGWMAGPYVGWKLTDKVYFDARAAWGRSSNDIWLNDPVVGYRRGSFDTDRWLATATLTGNYTYGAFRVSPQLGIAYGSESADAYRTSLGQTVDKTGATIGRLTFGPEFGYSIRTGQGWLVEPQFSVKGIWNFDDAPIKLSTGTVQADELRAQIEGGVMVKTPTGFAVRAAGSYDGLGDKNLEVWTAKVWVNIPID
jgi:outer membrane autotransporter protein